MIWGILLLLLAGGFYTCAGQENRTAAELLDISRQASINHPQTFNALDSQYRKLSERARLQIQTGKVMLFIAIGLMFFKVIQELLK
jgi:hypothetical protein